MNTENSPILPNGWSIKRVDDFNILLCGKDETWRFSDGISGTSSDFVYAFLAAILENGT